MSSLGSTIAALSVTMNSIGCIPVFLGLLKAFNRKEQQLIIFREMVFALAIMLAFGFWGESILDVIGVSAPIISIGGGIILFMIAINMIFPKPSQQDSVKSEPFIVPLATPLVAGPGTIATIMLYRHQVSSQGEMAIAVLVAWGISTLILLSSSFLEKILGMKILTAIERLMGMILTLIAAQMFVSGIAEFAQGYFGILPA